MHVSHRSKCEALNSPNAIKWWVLLEHYSALLMMSYLFFISCIHTDVFKHFIVRNMTVNELTRARVAGTVLWHSVHMHLNTSAVITVK